MLHTFGHPVAICWIAQTELVRVLRRNNVARMWPNKYNIMQHSKCCEKNLTIFKLDPTTRNMLQHVVTGWPKVRNMLCSTMLQYVASAWPGLYVINGISLSFIATICKFVSVVKNHSSRLFIIVKLLNLPCIIVGQNVYSSGSEN